MKRTNSLIWQEVVFLKSFEKSDILDLINHLAVLSPRKQVVWEICGSCGKIRYFLGTDRRYMKPLKQAFSAHGKIDFYGVNKREKITIAKQLKITKQMLSLKTENNLSVLKTALFALSNTKKDETLTLQIVLGDSFSPVPTSDKIQNPHTTLIDKITGNKEKTTNESILSIKDKASKCGFFSLIRVGAKAKNKKETNELLLSLTSTFRQFETNGIKLTFSKADEKSLNEAKIPCFLPLRLSTSELAGFVLMPRIDAKNAENPKLLHLPFWLKNTGEIIERSFAKSVGTIPQKLNIPIKYSLEHTVILGATGSGKSTVMLNLALEDINAGRGILVIDPKTDLINDILARVPENRTKDVVVIDPSDVSPVGINPFIFTKNVPAGLPSDKNLISDTILNVFKQVFQDSWGVYSQDILSASLLTLAQTENANLLQLVPLLTDDNFRRNITKNITDKAGLEPFWSSFEELGKAQKQQTIAPVLNKLRQFTLRPYLRNMLGQTRPKFNLCELFDKNKIVLYYYPKTHWTKPIK